MPNDGSIPIPDKRLGQHWLNDQASLHAICDIAELGLDDEVLEIGPGLGVLTELLSESAKHVYAVEIDKRLAAYIKEQNYPNVTVIEQDIRLFNLSDLPKEYKVIANIPYYLSSHIIKHLLSAENPPLLIALLVQKEVARRLAAPEGELSILGISAQIYAEVSLGPIVGADAFTPPPKVDSQIVVLRPRSLLPKEIDDKSFMHLIKAGFSGKRKKLVNSLSGGLRRDKNELTAIIARLGLDENVRAQELSIDEWIELYKNLEEDHAA